jgi:hypothetical protein
VAAADAGTPPGEWSARDVVAHLAAVEADVIQGRLRDLEAGGNPTWTWTEPGPLEDPEAGVLGVAADHDDEHLAALQAREA